MSMTPMVSLPWETVWTPSCFGVQPVWDAVDEPPQAVSPTAAATTTAASAPERLRWWFFMGRGSSRGDGGAGGTWVRRGLRVAGEAFAEARWITRAGQGVWRSGLCVAAKA